ncbi:MAG: hypothetical protein JSS14_19975 [Proteobacteria bacterium]|nr:hypothetical protein [Pseudomonadota bacterium]
MKKTSACLAVVSAAACLVAAPASWAKLAAPPEPTPEAKAKAAETAARTAWTGKVDAYKLCLAQDRAVDNYRAGASAAGKQVPAAAATPPCADPGPFAYVPPEAAKPLEAAGAHSPATPATSPHNSATPDAQAPKKQQ